MDDSLRKIKEAEERKVGGETKLPNIERKTTKFLRRKETLKALKKKTLEKKKRREEKRATGVPVEKPKTIESCRETDSTMAVEANVEDEEEKALMAEEVARDLQTDELSDYFNKGQEPKVLITFSDGPIKRSRKFAAQLCKVIPNSMRIGRKGSSVKKMVAESVKRKFTDILIINEDRFEPTGLLMIHLPDGPTAHFRLSNMVLSSKRQMKEICQNKPEVILNNFDTRLGQTIGRMLGAVFHYEPEFKGRRAVTFHNQRDYIFFRHHRYKFIKGKACLRELGPRFTLKLLSLQQGTFDSKYGEYEWILPGKRHELETSRRKFFL